jgi:hypothetical protein
MPLTRGEMRSPSAGGPAFYLGDDEDARRSAQLAAALMCAEGALGLLTPKALTVGRTSSS